MGVTSYGREPGYPKSQRQYDGKRVVSTIRDRYKILVDSDNDMDELIYSSLPFSMCDEFPGIGADAPRLTSMNLDRDTKVRKQWYLDMGYSQLTDQDAQNSQTPPDLRIPEWWWEFESIERVLTKDTDNTPIVNSVGEPFELTAPWVIPVLNIERHELTFSPATIINYVNHRNETEFWTAEPGQALMGGIRDKRDQQEVWHGVYYRKVSYVIKFAVPFVANALEGWTDLLLNRGNFYIDTSTGNPVAFTDSRGNLIQGNLELDGLRRESGLEPLVLRFQSKAEAEFNDLNLGPY